MWRPSLASTKKPPDRIYHYTDAAGLLGIIQTKTIWATDLAFLNDSREFVHAVGLVSRLVEELVRKTPAEEMQVRLASMALADATENVRMSLRVNVACYCSAADLLSQWRGYGAGLGYALGFDSTSLRAALEPSVDLPLAPVVYDVEEQLEALRQIAGPVLKYFIDNAGQVPSASQGSFLSAYLPFLGVCFQFKDPAFIEEQEWRSCNVRMVRPNGDTRFRASQSGVIPHEALDLGNGAANIASLREVIVGPGRNMSSVGRR